MAMSEERRRNLNAMERVLPKNGGSMYAGDIYAKIGIGDGVRRTTAGDRLYKDAIEDERFIKLEPEIASFALNPQYRPSKGSSTRPPAVARGDDRVALIVGADKSSAKYHVPRAPTDTRYGYLATLCGGHAVDARTLIAARDAESRRCNTHGCKEWWEEWDRRKLRARAP